MPTMRTNKYGEAVRNPTTKAEYRAEVISYMVQSGKHAQEALAANKEVRHNPEGLPEISMTKGYVPARKWAVAQDMEREGLVRITQGGWDKGYVYLVAGDNWKVD